MKRSGDDLVKTCSRLESGLRLGPDAIRPCVFSVFESPIYWDADDVPNSITKADIVEKRKRLFGQLNDDHSDIVCKKCLKVETKPFKEVRFDKLGFIDLAHYSYCNLRCNYCAFTQNNSFHKAKYDGLNILNKFDNADVEFDSSVDFNGGEPSILPDLDQYLETFRKKGIRIRLYTNAIRYSHAIEKAIADGTIAWLIISVDAGTRETFKVTKLKDAYDTVLENMARYVNAASHPKSGQVASKYIFTKTNYADEDIVGFINDMVLVKPHQVWLLYDFQDFETFSETAYESIISAYAKMYVGFLNFGITPSHFYESFLNPVTEESRKLVMKTKVAIESLDAKALTTHQQSLIFPHKRITLEQFTQLIATNPDAQLLMAPANIATKSIISNVDQPIPNVIIGDRSIQKNGKRINGTSIKHYADLKQNDCTHIIITSEYHFVAITNEISRYINLNKIQIFLIEDQGHESL